MARTRLQNSSYWAASSLLGLRQLRLGLGNEGVIVGDLRLHVVDLGSRYWRSAGPAGSCAPAPALLSSARASSLALQLLASARSGRWHRPCRSLMSDLGHGQHRRQSAAASAASTSASSAAAAHDCFQLLLCSSYCLLTHTCRNWRMADKLPPTPIRMPAPAKTAATRHPHAG